MAKARIPKRIVLNPNVRMVHSHPSLCTSRLNMMGKKMPPKLPANVARPVAILARRKNQWPTVVIAEIHIIELDCPPRIPQQSMSRQYSGKFISRRGRKLWAESLVNVCIGTSTVAKSMHPGISNIVSP